MSRGKRNHQTRSIYLWIGNGNDYYGCTTNVQCVDIERSDEMVTVIPSKDSPEVVRKRLEDAVKRFFIAIEKEKAPSADQSKSAQ